MTVTTSDQPVWLHEVFSAEERQQIGAGVLAAGDLTLYDTAEEWWAECVLIADNLLYAAGEIDPSLFPLSEAVSDCAEAHAGPALCGTVLARLLAQRPADPEAQRLLVSAITLYGKLDGVDPAAPGDLAWIHRSHDLGRARRADDLIKRYD